MAAPSPLISVIVPAFNVSSWITEAVQSIQRQSISDFEIIIIDDGSSDDTYNKAVLLSKDDPRIHVHKNEKNLGITTSLNIALSLASGEFIARMDADDIATPDRLEKQLLFLQDNPDYALVGAQMLTIDESGNRHGISPCPVSHEDAKKVILYSSPVPHIWLCRADVYAKLKGYRQLAPAEDYDFLLRMETLGLKYGNHPEALMMIRSRNGNTASVASLKQRKAQNYVLALYKERSTTGLTDSYSPEGFQKAIRSTALIERLHNRSSEYLAQSVRASGIVSRISYLLASVLLSPYNAQYVSRRLMYRRQMRRRPQ